MAAILLSNPCLARSQCAAFAQVVAEGIDNQGQSLDATALEATSQSYHTNCPATNCPFVTKCSTVSVYLGAATCVGGNVSFSYINSVTNGCSITQKASSGYGQSVTYSIHDPTKNGHVTFYADAIDECDDGSTVEAHAEITISYSGGDGDCSSCSTCAKPAGLWSGPSQLGGGCASVNGVAFGVSLGAATGGGSAGLIGIFADQPSTALAQPASLSLPFPRPDVAVLTNLSGVVLQVKPPQGLLVVSNLSTYVYQLLVLDNNANNVTPSTNGFYTYSGNPLVTWQVQNPDGASSSNRLKICELLSGQTNRVFQYSYNSGGGWSLLQPDGVTTISNWNTIAGMTNTMGWDTYSGATLVNRKTKTYRSVSGLPQPLLVQESVGTGTVALVTSYAYYSSDTNNGAFTNLVQRIDYPDGRWTYFLYDEVGRVATNFEAYLNNPAPPPGTVPDATTNRCKLTVYSYDSLFGDDSIHPWAPRETTVLLPAADGTLTETANDTTSYSYATDTYGNNLLVVEHTKTTSSGTIVERSQDYVLDLQNSISRLVGDQFRYGRPRSRSHTDGAVTVYDYCATNGTLIITNATGAIGGNGSWDWPGDVANVVDGVVTVETQDAVGRPLSRTSRDIRTGNLLTSDTDTYLSTDASVNSFQVVNLTGRTNTFLYDCCGLSTAIDPDGVVTYFAYDAMKRLTNTTVTYGGSTTVSTMRVLDGAGRVLATRRTGSDGSTITLSLSQYDVADRLVAETNALGGRTTIGYALVSNQQYVTNTYPDGGTRIESYYRDGSLQRVVGTAVHGKAYGYGVGSDPRGYICTYVDETNLSSSGASTMEWTRTYQDMAGRKTEVLYPDATGSGTTGSQFSYDQNNHLSTTVDPDGVINLYAYNAKGEREYSVISATGEYDIHYGTDQITFTTNDVTTDHSMTVRRTRTYVWDRLNVDASNLVATAETSVDGLQSWQTQYRDAGTPVTTRSQTVYGANGLRSVTNVAPDSSCTITKYSYGRLQSVARFDSNNNPLSSISYTYDPHGRQQTVTDARNGTTTFGYNNADLVTSVTTPNPGTLGDAPQITLTYYNAMLQATNALQPDGTSVSTEYLPTGELKMQYGSRTYPVGYGYDYAGRMNTMTNWSNFPSAGPRVTTWNYNLYRGWLGSKQYADGQGPTYDYTHAGRLNARHWARGITTAYTYDNAGQLATVGYDDGSTPDVTYTYDRLGRLSTVLQNGMTATNTYNTANQLVRQSFTGGTLDGLSVTNGFDQYLRRTSLWLGNPPSTLQTINYSYDAASRLQTVTDNATATPYSATYSYLANSLLMSQITFKSNTVTRMTTTKQYDFLNRLTTVQSFNAQQSTINSYNYQLNAANQRIRSSLADGSYWLYTYDSLGQVVAGIKYWADGTPVAGQQFDYTFDTIGNRTQTKAGGDQFGANLRTANYGANSLNQYTNRDVPAAFDVMGLGFATNAVTVNGQAAYRKGEYFRAEVPVSNGSTSVWQSVSVVATNQATASGSVFVPKTQEQFYYDLDGNLTNDGRWTYTWDGENRLVKLAPNTSIGPRNSLMFEYDWQGRRIHKQVWSNAIWNGTTTNDVKFVYDGWNLLAELNATNNNVIRAFMWGLDLSGSLQGAGGVGGLLEVVYKGAQTTNCFVAFDGNGNVAALADAGSTNTLAQYEYGPFAEVIRATGPMAKANPFRFSTKYQDDETDLLYYGRRYYNASTGRWISRDPIGEQGGLNLSRFVRNNPVQNFDPFGLQAQGAAQPITPEQQAAQDEWNKLGCGDCPVAALHQREQIALDNVIYLVDWSKQCWTLKDYADLLKKAGVLSTAGGYTSDELKKMPACIRKAFEWIESQNVLTAVTYVNIANLWLNPLSETRWCCLGSALGGSEALRQQWLYQRLTMVEKRCDALKNQTPQTPKN